VRAARATIARPAKAALIIKQALKFLVSWASARSSFPMSLNGSMARPELGMILETISGNPLQSIWSVSPRQK
jgi:hypothetical protein